MKDGELEEHLLVPAHLNSPSTSLEWKSCLICLTKSGEVGVCLHSRKVALRFYPAWHRLLILPSLKVSNLFEQG